MMFSLWLPGSDWPWSNRYPILLGYHLIYRNIKSIIMLRLVMGHLSCFDQITKNIWNTKTHIRGGENMRKGNYQCSQGTLVIPLPRFVPRGKDIRCGVPKHLPQCWLWAILGPCESGIYPNPSGSLSLPVLLAPLLTHSLTHAVPQTHGSWMTVLRNSISQKNKL